MLVRSTKGGEIVWRRKATLSCAKTKRSRHEQDTRHQPLCLLRHLLRLIGKRFVTFALMSPAISTARKAARGGVCHSEGSLTLSESRCLQGRRDDRAGGDARRHAKRRFNVRNRETCGPEGRRDYGIRIERVTRLPLLLSKRRFG